MSTPTAASAPTQTEPTAPAPRRPANRVRALLAAVGAQNLSLAAALVVVMAFFGLRNSAYLSLNNLTVISEAVTISGLLAVVQTVVIICGALDISVGSQAGLASVVSAMVFTRFGGSPLAGIAAAVALGVLVGVVNGLVIVYGRVNPVIATLAGLAAYKGVAQLISDGYAELTRATPTPGQPCCDLACVNSCATLSLSS